MARVHPALGRTREVELTEVREQVAAVLAAQPHRFCAHCKEQVEEAGRQRLDDFWVCRRCAPQVSVQDFRDLRRRRYLDVACPAEKQLRAFEVALEATRLDLEEIAATPAEQAALRANRPQRAQVFLTGLGTSP